jgi:ribose-phosphate pyrophosphokinase
MSFSDSVKARLLAYFRAYGLDRDKTRIIAASQENKHFSEKIAKLLSMELTSSLSKKFKNDETYVRIGDGVRSRNVYLLQSLETPVDTRIMEILLFADAAKRASAEKVHVIFPCLPYSRQDRITESREPISSKVLSKLLKVAGVDKVITIDLHANQLVGFYDDGIYIDNLPSSTLFANMINNTIINEKEKYVIVSPDAGGTKRAERFSKLIKSEDVDLASMQKKRECHNECASLKLVGDVKDRIAILYDDILDTGGTLISASKLLIEEGAKEVHIATTHALFNGTSIEKLAAAQKQGTISNIYITDSVRPNNKKYDRIKEAGLKLKMIPLGILIADCIVRTETQNHLSPLHSYEYIEDLYRDIEPKDL